MRHGFECEVAKEIGIPKAILLQNIFFWREENRLHKRNKHNNLYRTFNSAKDFQEKFYYMKQRTISRHLKELEDDGRILSGSYNKHKYDKTKRYTVTVKSIKHHMPQERSQELICQIGEWISQYVESISQSGEPIPYVNTNVNTDSKLITTSQSKIDDEVFSLLLTHNTTTLTKLVEAKGLSKSQAVTELFSSNGEYPKNCAHVNELVWYLYDFYDLHSLDPNFRFGTVNFFDKLNKAGVLDSFINNIGEEIDLDLGMESIKDEAYRTRDDLVFNLKFYEDTY